MSKGEDTYFFVKTLQGDITKIIDENGTTAATYAYDAWGKILSENENSAIEGLNPFRYRGYVYDEETELYYLQSRYYDPITGRFLNLDNPEFSDTGSGTPLSTNMFAYCENNPISGYDPSGEDAIWIHQSGAVYGAGHVSLLLQNSSGSWSYFYWGPSCVQLKKLETKYNGSYLKKLFSNPKKLRNTINTAIKRANGYCDNTYNIFILFDGNFEKSIKFVKDKLLPIYKVFKKAKSDKYYDLVNRNCLHVSCSVLLKGKFTYKGQVIKQIIKKAKDYIVPSVAIVYIFKSLAKLNYSFNFGV